MPEFFSLTGPTGLRASFTDVGAALVSALVPGSNGEVVDVILGYDTAEEYLTDDSYLGVIVGRYANRIANGRFALDGSEYQLAINEPPDTLHSGPEGFHSQIWNAETTEHSLRFSRVSPAGEAGFPGTMQISVTYELTKRNEIDIRYEATTDAPTVVNLTNHAYFNLAGEGSPSIAEHEITIAGSHYVEPAASGIPSGQLPPVTETPLDFRQPRPIGTPDENFPALQITNGYDQTIVLDEKSYQYAATVRHRASGRVLEVLTDQPGLHFYGGNYLCGATGKGGKPYTHRSAFCLEAQRYADSPNHPNFPSTVLRPGETYRQRTTYRFPPA